MKHRRFFAPTLGWKKPATVWLVRTGRTMSNRYSSAMPWEAKKINLDMRFKSWHCNGHLFQKLIKTHGSYSKNFSYEECCFLKQYSNRNITDTNWVEDQRLLHELLMSLPAHFSSHAWSFSWLYNLLLKSGKNE